MGDAYDDLVPERPLTCDDPTCSPAEPCATHATSTPVDKPLARRMDPVTALDDDQLTSLVLHMSWLGDQYRTDALREIRWRSGEGRLEAAHGVIYMLGCAANVDASERKRITLTTPDGAIFEITEDQFAEFEAGMAWGTLPEGACEDCGRFWDHPGGNIQHDPACPHIQPVEVHDAAGERMPKVEALFNKLRGSTPVDEPVDNEPAPSGVGTTQRFWDLCIGTTFTVPTRWGDCVKMSDYKWRLTDDAVDAPWRQIRELQGGEDRCTVIEVDKTVAAEPDGDFKAIFLASDVPGRCRQLADLAGELYEELNQEACERLDSDTLKRVAIAAGVDHTVETEKVLENIGHELLTVRLVLREIARRMNTSSAVDGLTAIAELLVEEGFLEKGPNGEPVWVGPDV